MKNWAVALFGSLVRAMARVPRSLDRPLPDSFLIGGLGLLLLHAGLEAAALDHEVGDDAVEDGAVVELVVDVAEEVRDGDRGLVGVQLDLDGARASLHHDRGCSAWGSSWMSAVVRDRLGGPIAEAR